MTITPSELAQMFAEMDATGWTCGHSGGSVCAECYRELAAKAHDLAEENFQLRDALAGWQCVPKEPTEAMLIAGDEANPTAWNDGTPDGFGTKVANDIYRAMLRAAFGEVKP